MKPILTLIFFALVCVCACSPTLSNRRFQNMTLHDTIYVDKAFSYQEEKAIQAAADQWAESTRGIIELNMIYGFDMQNTDSTSYTNRLMIKKLNGSDKLTHKIDSDISHGDEDAQVLGYTLKQEEFAMIYIVADRLLDAQNQFDPKHFENVVLHEEGHLFGLSHADEKLGIMNANYDYKLEKLANTKLEYLTCFTLYDLEQFCSNYYCDPAKLNYCGK